MTEESEDNKRIEYEKEQCETARSEKEQSQNEYIEGVLNDLHKINT